MSGLCDGEARYIAKNIVAAGLAENCTVSLAYAIGRAEPVAVDIDAHQDVPWERTDRAAILARRPVAK